MLTRRLLRPHRPQTFVYIGLEARLRHMLEDKLLNPLLQLPWPGAGPAPTAAERMQGAVPLRPTLDGDCANLHQSVGWWEGVHCATFTPPVVGTPKPPGWDSSWSPGGHSIALSLNVDGFQPFKRGGVTISPMTCMVLNLPENLRHRWEHMPVAGIIPRREPKNMNLYLRLLVDELLRLYTVGVAYSCPIDKQPKVSYVKLLFTCADHPAHTHINMHMSHAGAHGCHKCDIVGSRRNERMGFNGYADLAAGVRPRALTHALYLARGIEYASVMQSRPSDKELPQLLAAGPRNVQGRSDLTRLPYFDIVEHTLPDMMHTCQGVVKTHMINLIARGRLQKYNLNGVQREARAAAIAARPLLSPPVLQPSLLGFHTQQQLKSIAKANRAASKKYADAVELRAKEERNDASTALLFTFHQRYNIGQTAQDVLTDTWYKGIRAPGNIAPNSLSPFKRSGDLTAYHLLNFAKVYGKYLFQQHYRSVVAQPQRRAGDPPCERVHEATLALAALCQLLDILTLCLQSSVSSYSKVQTDEKVRAFAADFEKNLPQSEQAIVMHVLLFHMPGTIRRWGPTRGYWCFPFERLASMAAAISARGMRVRAAAGACTGPC